MGRTRHFARIVLVVKDKPEGELRLSVCLQFKDRRTDVWLPGMRMTPGREHFFSRFDDTYYSRLYAIDKKIQRHSRTVIEDRRGGTPSSIKRRPLIGYTEEQKLVWSFSPLGSSFLSVSWKLDNKQLFVVERYNTLQQQKETVVVVRNSP